MVKAQKFIYAKRFVGEPKTSDFQLVDEELPALKDNGECDPIEWCMAWFSVI